MRVADLMKAPAPTIDPGAPLLEVIHRIITEGEEELVVMAGRRPTGVITARQILALLEPENAGWRPHHAADLVRGRTPRLLPDLTLPAAARALSSDRYDALPVVDYRGDLVGLLAHRHLVAHIAHGDGPSDRRPTSSPAGRSRGTSASPTHRQGH
jgi:CBS domain-containing protein